MAKLHINLLAKQLTEQELRTALEKPPKSLREYYSEVISRISKQEEKQEHLAMITLKWIAYAKEPLQAGALQHALAVTSDTRDVNEKDLIDIEQLISFCAGIVTIDSESGIIRFVHYTVQEYLENALPSADSDTEIAKICLKYLALDVFSTSCKNQISLNERLEKYKLSKYAASHWADHVRGRQEERLQDIVVATFESDGRRDSMLQLQGQGFLRGDFYSSYNCSLLHLASSNGLPNLFSNLLSKYKQENFLGSVWNRERLSPFGV